MIFLMLMPIAEAIGVSPAELTVNAYPGDVIEKSFILYGDADVTSSQEWIHTNIVNDRLYVQIEVPPNTHQEELQEFFVVQEKGSRAAIAGVKIPVHIIVEQTGIPVMLGLLVSASIVAIGVVSFTVFNRHTKKSVNDPGRAA